MGCGKRRGRSWGEEEGLEGGQQEGSQREWGIRVLLGTESMGGAVYLG